MSAPIRTIPDRDHTPRPSAIDARARRAWSIVIAVSVTAALLGGSLFLVGDRGSAPGGGAAQDEEPTAPEGADEPGRADPDPDDGPGTDDGADRDDETDPDRAASPTIRYGDESPANWDVTGVAASDVLNVRAGPGTTFAVTGSLAADTIELASTGRIARVDGVLWRQVVVPGAATGWVHARYLTAHQPVTPPRPTPSQASTLPASLLGAEWDHVPTTQKVIALTFDAGANADGVPSILQTLEATGTPATFFLTGRWTEDHPELARRIAARYPVGNHSVTHPYFTKLTDAHLREEVTAAEATIERVAGSSPRPFFRFPYGDRDARTIRLVNEAGYGSFRWTVDTLGWKGTSGGMTVSTVLGRVVDTARPGQIVLLHVGSHPTDRSTLDADALPRIIEQLREQGYRFITLDEALTIAGD